MTYIKNAFFLNVVGTIFLMASPCLANPLLVVGSNGIVIPITVPGNGVSSSSSSSSFVNGSGAGASANATATAPAGTSSNSQTIFVPGGTSATATATATASSTGQPFTRVTVVAPGGGDPAVIAPGGAIAPNISGMGVPNLTSGASEIPAASPITMVNNFVPINLSVAAIQPSQGSATSFVASFSTPPSSASQPATYRVVGLPSRVFPGLGLRYVPR